jgi:hypothetical protein
VVAKYAPVLLAVLSLAGCNQLLGLDDPVAAVDAAVDAAVVDAAEACEADELSCGGTCVKVATSSDHCGRCDHACGGGVCSEGVCLSFKVGSFPGATELAATADAVYVGHAGGVSSCPMPTGCGDVMPAQIATGVDGRHELAVAGDHVYFSVDVEGGHQMWQCPIAGCAGAPVLLASSPSAVLDLRSTAATLYWRREETALSSCAVDNCMGTLRDYPVTAFGDVVYSLDLNGSVLYIGTSLGLAPCPADSDCPEDAVPIPGSARVEKKFRVHDGVAYWFAREPPSNQIFRCQLDSGCFNATTTFAQGGADVVRLEVDATGVYWLSHPKMDPALRHCPLTGCADEQRGADLVPPSTFRVPPTNFALGPGFVYWIEGDDVLAVARP